jgi:hypothetical protein
MSSRSARASPFARCITTIGSGCSRPVGAQQRVLTEKRKQLDKAIRAIGAARRALDAKSEPDWTLFTRIIKEITMQNETDWTKQYYSAKRRPRSTHAGTCGRRSCRRK